MVRKGTRIHLLESRNRCAHGVDKLVASADTLIALPLESPKSSVVAEIYMAGCILNMTLVRPIA